LEINEIMNACETILRIILAIYKTLLGLIGATLAVTTSLIKWSNITQLKKYNEIGSILNLVLIIDTIIYTLLGLGCILMILAVIGLVGICLTNRGFLLVYEFILAIIFLAHLASLILLIAISGFIEQQYRTHLNAQLTVVNTNAYGDMYAKCAFMRGLSSYFNCCGLSTINGPQDFTSSVTRVSCCADWTRTQGCAQPAVDWLKSNAIYFLIIPTSVILFVEVSTLICVPLLVFRVNKRLRSVRERFERDF
jgi:hypothetical protein